MSIWWLRWLVVGGFAALTCGSVFARPDFLPAWQQKYPESNADDLQCQLCHQNAGGNEPWNAYGWDIRDAYDGDDIDLALEFVELNDHDGDPLSVSSGDEIRRSFQPGWTAGANNTVYCDNNLAACGGAATLSGQLPPEDIPATTALDLPAAVTDPITTPIPFNATSLSLMEIAGAFNAPLRAVKAPGIDGSLFVVEQTGKIFRVDIASGEKTLFLDVSDDLVAINQAYDERGLLGLAFHPDFATNGLFYTYQSEPLRSNQDASVDFPASMPPDQNPNHRSMVVEYQASNPSCNSFVTKRKNLMIIDQPQSNHNGGDLAFDGDGYLYISVGDGGSANDQGPGHGLLGNGRNNTNVLGTILRVDPLGSDAANGEYGIPATNPFIGGDPGLDEIFAYGFRNPFRISFDAQTGELYTGDVGQNQLEEVNLVTNGGNFGWNWKEGSFFFYNSASTGAYISNTAPPGLPNNVIDPVGEYDHGEGISVTGGYVYRGTTIANTNGKYVFGDFSGSNFASGEGRLFALDLQTNTIEEFMLTNSVPGYITGFGQDANNEIYVVVNNQFNPSGVEGRLLKLVESGDTVPPPDAAGESALCPPDEDVCFPIRGSNGAVAMICL